MPHGSSSEGLNKPALVGHRRRRPLLARGGADLATPAKAIARRAKAADRKRAKRAESADSHPENGAAIVRAGGPLSGRWGVRTPRLPA
jgi:hypothetical protein